MSRFAEILDTAKEIRKATRMSVLMRQLQNELRERAEQEVRERKEDGNLRADGNR